MKKLKQQLKTNRLRRKKYWIFGIKYPILYECFKIYGSIPGTMILAKKNNKKRNVLGRSHVEIINNLKN
ncbi:hypothetical protein BpHYR1_046900 [Brachionus plicatilis]|uniref:Uncharacterized protein n=1 Tax=Brachionus plicatilis TaxID=10195 RepID=A0A3M7QBC9_BRAPC|nr:hypothetical protein BpHYR1_046900 [Brachionus plicatilis]